jgi:hypothetical protein
MTYSTFTAEMWGSADSVHQNEHLGNVTIDITHSTYSGLDVATKPPRKFSGTLIPTVCTPEAYSFGIQELNNNAGDGSCVLTAVQPPQAVALCHLPKNNLWRVWNGTLGR